VGRQSLESNRQLDTDEGPLGITGTLTRGGGPGREGNSRCGEGLPAIMAVAAAVRKAVCGLRFKSLMHRLAGQRWQRCGREGYDLSAGEQCPGHLTDSSSGHAEAPASAPAGVPSCRAIQEWHEAVRGWLDSPPISPPRLSLDHAPGGPAVLQPPHLRSLRHIRSQGKK
jgi:hypothetical protein